MTPGPERSPLRLAVMQPDMSGHAWCHSPTLAMEMMRGRSGSVAISGERLEVVDFGYSEGPADPEPPGPVDQKLSPRRRKALLAQARRRGR